MIVFDLRCDGEHRFEAWFASGAAYEDQRGRGLLSCPVCGTTAVAKAAMAPRVGASRSVDPARPADPRALLQMIAGMQAEALKRSTWVGRRFAAEARAIHDGEREEAVIHGQATADEARALADDGIAVAPLLVPVTPPEALN